MGIMGQRTDFHMVTMTEIMDSDVWRNSRAAGEIDQGRGGRGVKGMR